MLNKYRWLVGLLLAVVVAAGFGFKTPNARFEEIEMKVERTALMLDQRIDSLAELKPLVETSAIIACLNISERERIQYRLPCGTLLRQYVVPQSTSTPSSRQR